MFLAQSPTFAEASAWQAVLGSRFNSLKFEPLRDCQPTASAASDAIPHSLLQLDFIVSQDLLDLTATNADICFFIKPCFSCNSFNKSAIFS
jgi:hypothetical protein